MYVLKVTGALSPLTIGKIWDLVEQRPILGHNGPIVNNSLRFEFDNKVDAIAARQRAELLNNPNITLEVVRRHYIRG